MFVLDRVHTFVDDILTDPIMVGSLTCDRGCRDDETVDLIINAKKKLNST